MRFGGIFQTENGAALGEDLDTAKQTACADQCGQQYATDPIGYSICYADCWKQALPGGTSTTQPSTTTPGTTTPPAGQDIYSTCYKNCSQQYPNMASLEYINCYSGCLGLPQTNVPVIPGITPGTSTPGTPSVPITPGTTTPGGGTPTTTSSSLGVGTLIAGAAVIGLGVYLIWGTDKKATMKANRRRHRRSR